ncbi:hypothetical protein JWV26_05395 [Ectopseudomonas toyotomiensis]|uniref:Uncharacterized protein n=1 Tax=Ectopseudomonas toyotomiensis TaxID=554344 RepID=A0A1I5V7H4_9GAMM|nr:MULTISPECIES: hypothetical protein [Pseudomonas]PIA72598.1 hypothetical protein CDR19_13065 [Pseudomonas toyotomiensis]QSL93796.1 hypothetical protein JWV26_05395 [Pseudomonas toyotomiensis]SDA80744.1 hypothetical protein SAMN03159475_4436 [Pseudomonas sp. NFPP33]SFQ03484.1 hypothetical protein SAMN05216177_107117 [Pseudomonas toyotomiensis]
MSLQMLWSLFLVHPAGVVNSLALFFALAGAWLCLMTRVREQRGMARVLAQGELDESEAQDERTVRINRFFYRFGAVCLGAALLLSWLSTRL